MLKLKKGASTPVIVIVLLVFCGTIATFVMGQTGGSLENVNSTSQQVISLGNNGVGDIDLGSINSNPEADVDKDAHAHDWRLVNKVVINANEREDFYICYTCGETKKEPVSGNFEVDIDFDENENVNFNGSNRAELHNYVKSQYRLNTKYIIEFDYIIQTGSVTATSMGFATRIYSTDKSSSKLMTVKNFTGTSGKMHYEITFTDATLQSSHPILGFELTYPSNTSASVKISNFKVYAADIPSHTHKLCEWTIVKDANCKEAGYSMRNCEVDGCPYFEQKTIAIKPHLWYKKELSVATCTKKGTYQNTCLSCGLIAETTTDYGPHITELKVIQESTSCKVRGKRGFVCSVCNAQEDVVTYYADHKYNVTVNKEPSCTEQGLKTYKCSVCNDTLSETLDYAHKKQIRQLKPDCQTVGMSETYCTLCDKVFDRIKYTDKTPHEYAYTHSKIEYFDIVGYETTVFYYKCSGCERIYKTDMDMGANYPTFEERFESANLDSFRLNSVSYKFEKGMTWLKWLTSSFNLIAQTHKETENGFLMQGGDKWYFIKDNNGNAVNYNTVINGSGYSYSLVEFTDTFTFKIGDTNYTTKNNMTWNMWLKSEYKFTYTTYENSVNGFIVTMNGLKYRIATDSSKKTFANLTDIITKDKPYTLVQMS